MLRQCLSLLGLLFLCFVLNGCGSDVTEVGWTVTVAPLAGEDILAPCTYNLLLEPIGQVQQGILVLFARGDTDQLYMDKTFREAALAMHYAILWAHECPAASSGDFQADAARGQGRMLAAAISQLAAVTQHSELETVGMFLYGFSAAGVLTATMANDYPERLMGTIQYAPGSAYTDLDGVAVTPAAAAMPTLILANADDPAAGTSRSLRYFQRGRALRAPWAYGVQNNTQHCCNLSTRDVILPWMRAVIAANAASASGTKAVSAGTMSYFTCTLDGVSDGNGETDCKFTAAGLGEQPAAAQDQVGWLPDQASGAAWLAWVTHSGTN